MNKENTDKTPSAPAEKSAQTCPRCHSPMAYYDGCLGYEAMRCQNDACRYEYDLNWKANGNPPPETPKQSPRPWLWPDRVIGKRESRRLREEHNGLVETTAQGQNVRNSEMEILRMSIVIQDLRAQRDELLAAAKKVDALFYPAQSGYSDSTIAAIDTLHAKISKAEKGGRP